MQAAVQQLKSYTVFGLSVLLFSCSGKFVSSDQLADDPQASRYSIAQDRAPETALAAHEIETTTPRKEPLSRHGNKSPYKVNGKTYQVLASAEDYREDGIASWYGAKFHGHTTSNGEVFDMNKISAAHKTLPLPSWVRVTNLDNGKSIDVRVNDRGPFHGGRIIDLSYAAAVKLGYQDKGTARVRVEALHGAALDTHSYFVQVGAFSKKESASNLEKKLAAEIKDKVDVYKDELYRVRIGPVQYDRAVALQQQYTGGELGKPLIIVKN
ncbi:septal ring lytic transglycosylase RlpA family protein [Reinekea marinisedimentorum]|uniref:Endolytic peptidoglycan transglycosylase RlpA n=1 Tax=Reinekea marinisedimentorum TaxID=230495 RepID=A0A4R3I6R8_9GAMM|nr:septal ring lytic transglycosylase RlpA family protein [Reinekea marinisedimentorum]TCS41676.1 rare lipoprotein A [Reinekea marinisedimentorum]